MKRYVVSLLAVVVLILSSFTFSGFTFSSDKEREFFGEEKPIGFVEERILSKATLDDDFTDDKVLVIMNKQETDKFRSYACRDFTNVNIREVRNLTETSSIALREQKEQFAENGINPIDVPDTSEQRAMQIDDNDFRTILSLQLQEPSKQNVLNTIKELEKRDDILYAGPNFIHEQASTPTDPRYTAGQQWGLNQCSQLKQSTDCRTGADEQFPAKISGVPRVARGGAFESLNDAPVVLD